MTDKQQIDTLAQCLSLIRREVALDLIFDIKHFMRLFEDDDNNGYFLKQDEFKDYLQRLAEPFNIEVYDD